MDIKTTTAAGTSLATTATGGMTVLQYADTYIGIAASLIGIGATALVTYWKYQEHKRSKQHV